MTTVSEVPQNTPESEAMPAGRRRRWYFSLGFLALLVGGSLGWLALSLLSPPTWHGIVVESAGRPPNFTLTDQNGQPVSLYDFHGQVVLLYFGYTYCPDVCPATLSELVEAEEILGSRGDEVEIIMITVDPERDTPAHLGEYLAYFDDSFIGLTGTEEEILGATTPLGIYYEKHEGSAASGYLIDHTATIMALDKSGALRLVYPFGVTGEEIASDMAQLVKR